MELEGINLLFHISWAKGNYTSLKFPFQCQAHLFSKKYGELWVTICDYTL